MNDCDTSRPASRYGHRRIFRNGQWEYQWLDIPENFEASRSTLQWDTCNDQYVVVPRNTDDMTRRRRERPDMGEMNDSWTILTGRELTEGRRTRRRTRRNDELENLRSFLYNRT
jgi:hypothetical protein